MIGAMETKPASVLIIESHPIMRLALCSAIAAEPDLMVMGAKFTTKESLNFAIMDEVLFLSKKPDIILLGLGNSGREDIEVLKALCKTLPCTPIMVLTTNEVLGQEQAALEAGAHRVMTKATPRYEIINALREIHQKDFIQCDIEILEQEATPCDLI